MKRALARVATSGVYCGHVRIGLTLAPNYRPELVRWQHDEDTGVCGPVAVGGGADVCLAESVSPSRRSLGHRAAGCTRSIPCEISNRTGWVENYKCFALCGPTVLLADILREG